MPHVVALGLTAALRQAEITVQSPVDHVLKDIPPPFSMKLSFSSWSDVALQANSSWTAYFDVHIGDYDTSLMSIRVMFAYCRNDSLL